MWKLAQRLFFLSTLLTLQPLRALPTPNPPPLLEALIRAFPPILLDFVVEKVAQKEQKELARAQRKIRQNKKLPRQLLKKIYKWVQKPTEAPPEKMLEAILTRLKAPPTYKKPHAYTNLHQSHYYLTLSIQAPRVSIKEQVYPQFHLGCPPEETLHGLKPQTSYLIVHTPHTHHSPLKFAYKHPNGGKPFLLQSFILYHPYTQKFAVYYQSQGEYYRYAAHQIHLISPQEFYQKSQHPYRYLALYNQSSIWKIPKVIPVTRPTIEPHKKTFISAIITIALLLFNQTPGLKTQSENPSSPEEIKNKKPLKKEKRKRFLCQIGMD